MAKIPISRLNSAPEKYQQNEFNQLIEDLQEIDIGIMPLPNDEWANGKCGFKALQYMSLGVPAIVSPVGVNTDIVEHGMNGYVCDTAEEWEASLRAVLSDKDKVKTVAQNSRKKIEDYYSVKSNKDNFIQLFD